MSLKFLILFLSTVSFSWSQSAQVWFEQWNELDQDGKCNQCAQLVYSNFFNEDIEVALNFAHMMIQYQCDAITANQTYSIACSAQSNLIFDVFYPYFYYGASSYRDYFCIPICGNSGQHLIH